MKSLGSDPTSSSRTGQRPGPAAGGREGGRGARRRMALGGAQVLTGGGAEIGVEPGEDHECGGGLGIRLTRGSSGLVEPGRSMEPRVIA